MDVKFADFLRQYEFIKQDINNAIQGVLDSGWYIMGNELDRFEHEFAGYIGSKYAVGCASGTEAIALALMAIGVGNGDEVLTVPNTAVPTATGISMTGAVPTFVDIDPKTLMMDIKLVEQRISEKTKAIIPVHLFGSSVDLGPLIEIASTYNIPIIEDCAQSCGTEYGGRKTGSIGCCGTFSFYPSKNLGCYGDGGAVTTNDEVLYEKLKMLRNYGQVRRYHHASPGINSRLDEIQAAILRVKLTKLDEWNRRRNHIAEMYRECLQNLPVIIPSLLKENKHSYHLYVILVEEREKFVQYLQSEGIQTLIHYPIPVHMQEVYKCLGNQKGDFPIAERVAEQIVSLPMWPELTDEEINYVCKKISAFFA